MCLRAFDFVCKHQVQVRRFIGLDMRKNHTCLYGSIKRKKTLLTLCKIFLGKKSSGRQKMIQLRLDKCRISVGDGF